MHWSGDDHRFMGIALQLAKKGQYTARPNPMVGCVLVNNGEIIGKGWHQKFGENHAEINALNDAKKHAPHKIKGATCYVSLEPCAHTGKTKPCASALVKSGVIKVIAAMQDPNPKVLGNGFKILNQAGIETHCGLLKAQAEKLLRGFISRNLKCKPWVTVKLAMSLDGRTALANGASKWITGSAAREDVQKIRARQDGIITGIGTVIADDPSLTVRSEEKWFSSLTRFEQPTRIILDRDGKSRLDNKIFNQDARVWWVKNSVKDKLISIQKHVEIVNSSSIEHLLNYCATNEMNHVLVEAGHTLAASFLRANLVNEIVIYMAPKLMGNNAMGLFDLNVLQMDDCPTLQLQNIRQFDDDIRLIYHPTMAQ